MRVCMDPRLLPGVRCSVLKIVKRLPSCWITMPGRSCVAFVLLIRWCDPAQVLEPEPLPLKVNYDSEIPTGCPKRRARDPTTTACGITRGTQETHFPRRFSV